MREETGQKHLKVKRTDITSSDKSSFVLHSCETPIKNLTPWANPNHIQVYKPSHSSTAHKLSWIRHIPAYLKHDVTFRQNPHWAANIRNMQWQSRPPSYCNISANHTCIPFWKLLNDGMFHLALRLDFGWFGKLLLRLRLSLTLH